jgi:CheY-like chemotaxis protein
VLIIEDHADVRDAMVELVEWWGHDVRIAADGETGLVTALAWLPDVVCLNMSLPRMNGDEVARRIVVALGAERPILIAISGFGTAADRAVATKAGFDGFCVKPCEPRTLEAVLNGQLPLPADIALPAAARLVRATGTAS